MAFESESGMKWYVDFKSASTKYIVFRNKILKYKIDNPAEKESVRDECRKMGIPDEKMDWSE